MVLALDYSRWDDSRHEWESPSAFSEATEWQDGLHSIKAEGGLPIDLLFVNVGRIQEGQRVLPVFFSAAVGSRNAAPGPFFSGSGIAGAAGVAALCVADPSLAIDDKLALAWYAGSRRQRTQEILERLLATVADRLAVELLLVGGSGGGFAALQLAGCLGGRASALAWNPQTDFLKYYRSAIRTYMETCFPEAGEADSSGDAARLLACGIEHQVLESYAAGRRPRRLLYLQNADDDFHVARHAKPFVRALGMQSVGSGKFAATNNAGIVWFGSWGRGHDAPPKEVLRALVERLIDPSASADDCVEWLQSQQEASLGPGPGPLHVRAFIQDDTLKVECFPSEAAAVGNLQYAFYVFSESERIQTAWYQASRSARFPVMADKLPTRVAGFAMDSHGQKVNATAAVRQSSSTRIFVVGSCVSRDAFVPMPPAIEISTYVARSSLASAFGKKRGPAWLVDAAATLKSPFQRRMVTLDIGKGLSRLLTAEDYDFVLLDLIDERFAVVFADGVPVTLSGELASVSSEMGAQLRLKADSPTREPLWRSGVERLFALAPPGRVILNKVFWATRSEVGPLEDQERISAANSTLESMYRYLIERWNPRVIEYPDGLLVADSQHKWGASPFHYIPAVYEHTRQALTDHVLQIGKEPLG